MAAVLSAAVAIGISVANAAEPKVASTASSVPATSDQISQWIADLDSNKYLIREQATQHLLTSGRAAMDALLNVANADRPEPSDRAVWILKQLGESDDEQLASDALTRLVRVERRPSVVKDAQSSLDRLAVVICQRKLAGLGAKMLVRENEPDLSPRPQVEIELGDGWKGTPEDLKRVSKLAFHSFRMEGDRVGDAEIEMFQSMDGLTLLKLYRTRVTPQAIDVLKERQPNAVVYVRNRALLGIQGVTRDKSKGGVTVIAPPVGGTGAAAAGLEMNDIIVELDGESLKDFDRLTSKIGQHDPGDQIELTIVRGDQKLTKRVTLGTAKDFAE